MSNARNIASIAGEDVLNASNEIVPVYACRAWVNFSGNQEESDNSTPETSDPLFIRDHENIDSVIWDSTGNYTVNFANAMPHANYCVAATHTHTVANSADYSCKVKSSSDYNVSYVKIVTAAPAGGYYNYDMVNVAIFC